MLLWKMLSLVSFQFTSLHSGSAVLVCPCSVPPLLGHHQVCPDSFSFSKFLLGFVGATNMLIHPLFQSVHSLPPLFQSVHILFRFYHGCGFLLSPRFFRVEGGKRELNPLFLLSAVYRSIRFSCLSDKFCSFFS